VPFEIEKDFLGGILAIRPRVFRDERGFFLETFKASDFVRANIPDRFKQENHSRSNRGVLRGLHFQIPPFEQGKLVRVTRGRAIDVVVDIRESSPTFGRSLCYELSESDPVMLYIPPGFAHGFQALEDNTDFQYVVTNEYSPEHERGIRYDDPDLNIAWPILRPLIAPRDATFPRLRDVPSVF